MNKQNTQINNRHRKFDKVFPKKDASNTFYDSLKEFNQKIKETQEITNNCFGKLEKSNYEKVKKIFPHLTSFRELCHNNKLEEAIEKIKIVEKESIVIANVMNDEIIAIKDRNRWHKTRYSKKRRYNETKQIIESLKNPVKKRLLTLKIDKYNGKRIYVNEFQTNHLAQKIFVHKKTDNKIEEEKKEVDENEEKETEKEQEKKKEKKKKNTKKEDLGTILNSSEHMNFENISEIVPKWSNEELEQFMNYFTKQMSNCKPKKTDLTKTGLRAFYIDPVLTFVCMQFDSKVLYWPEYYIDNNIFTGKTDAIILTDDLLPIMTLLTVNKHADFKSIQYQMLATLFTFHDITNNKSFEIKDQTVIESGKLPFYGIVTDGDDWQFYKYQQENIEEEPQISFTKVLNFKENPQHIFKIIYQILHSQLEYYK
ncbi:hypothetical protein M0812_25012 [Anaeramoeba flamelloides]|uniref:Uncharacterized protein n=1 Tax=Anaeramoeba flamelloides TaxID=1746091 RepID=A0AAV7YQD4_9EUKA|nr:hypothetical protein M0812_25012 [Anaeramoeba flamelloides]